MDIQITWHNIEPSESVEADIKQRFEKLVTFCDQITKAHITLDRPNLNNSQANEQISRRSHTFNVVLEIHVPDTEIVASHTPADERVKQDLHRLIHHAFDAARRQLQEYVRIRRGKVKHHESNTG
jgi:ribosome-associated translation inhibitor RaiA